MASGRCAVKCFFDWSLKSDGASDEPAGKKQNLMLLLHVSLKAFSRKPIYNIAEFCCSVCLSLTGTRNIPLRSRRPWILLELSSGRHQGHFALLKLVIARTGARTKNSGVTRSPRFAMNNNVQRRDVPRRWTKPVDFFLRSAAKQETLH